MAEVVVKLESILSRERENVGSGVDDGRFFNKVKYFFTGKTDLVPAHAEGIKADLMLALSKRRKANLMQAHAEGSKSEINADNLSVGTFTYAELVSATNNHTYEESELGAGVATYVRRRHIGTSKLDFRPEEFNHPNLVKLLGYRLKRQELYCVYELIPDPRLDELLFGELGTTSLSWVARLKIAVGAAEGLSFLHEKGHPAYNQFKTACILVDTDHNARLQNFEVENSFVTLGSYSFELNAQYAAPEWFRYQADVKLEGTKVAQLLINKLNYPSMLKARASGARVND
ncbi:hypothetical protein L1987_61036 [Smallanthus sonchifolius]|uniref:Uncharacterized protein n=1 Tax=Smallanthus sonchifolius TaxID=185202 RepID=A0ACB9D9N7_9ASTR|nr:hypothetical protein L1987_61036 [Smallanthus sonchifolius]